MADKTSKETLRSELNQAIEDYVARGGRIKKLEVKKRESVTEEQINLDQFESGSDLTDSDNESFLGIFKQDGADF